MPGGVTPGDAQGGSPGDAWARRPGEWRPAEWRPGEWRPGEWRPGECGPSGDSWARMPGERGVTAAPFPGTTSWSGTMITGRSSAAFGQHAFARMPSGSALSWQHDPTGEI